MTHLTVRKKPRNSVLPAAAMANLYYDALDGSQNGRMAMAAYLDATKPDIPAAEEAAIEYLA